MVDAHCHLNFQAFSDDYLDVAKKAFAKGVSHIINVGTQLSSSQEAVRMAQENQEFFAIVGIHPHHADKVTEGNQGSSEWLKKLEELAQKPKVLAIGEIGLDYYSYASNGIVDKAKQKEVFKKQLQLAHKLKLPLQIHNRLAGEEMIEILKEHKNLLLSPPGMFHCFQASLDVLKSALEMGFCIGFDGNVTYKGLAPGETVPLSELVAKTPLESIILETDSPYLSPVPLRGKRNEPQNILLIAEKVAEIKNLPLGEVIAQTEKNVYTCFSKLK